MVMGLDNACPVALKMVTTFLYIDQCSSDASVLLGRLTAAMRRLAGVLRRLTGVLRRLTSVLRRLTNTLKTVQKKGQN